MEYCGLCANKNRNVCFIQVLSTHSFATEKNIDNQEPSSATVLPATILSLSQGQSVSASLRNLGQYNRNNWKDAAHINESGIRTQQSTVPITGANMAILRSSNLATNECYVFILEPFVRTKPCTFLSTFEVIRESTTKFCGLCLRPTSSHLPSTFKGSHRSDIVSNGISSLNSSWEQDREASLVRCLQLILRDSGQNLDKTAPPKFRSHKFPIVYIEAHIELAKHRDPEFAKRDTRV
ncbi:hypothetical protein B0H14DRAFT_2567371 [Mycena olivaceomarginata]|nr:hypothetical protein B0H14DRAFT_2567371 [Mycena olivaceomarginata]